MLSLAKLGGSSLGEREERGLSTTTKPDELLADEAPVTEIDEFRALIDEGHERGFLFLEHISAKLDEVEVTKEQVRELHAHLTEHGIDVVDAAGKPVKPGGEPAPKRVDQTVTAARTPARAARRASPRSTSRSSLRSTRCGCTCARSARSSC